MALFSECSLKCARKVLDTADIVREAMLRQPPKSGCPIYLALVCVISPKAPPLKYDVGCWQSFTDHNQARNMGIFRVSSDDVVNETGVMVFRKRGEFVVDAPKEN